MVSGLEGPLCEADRFLRLMCPGDGGQPGTTGSTVTRITIVLPKPVGRTGLQGRGAEAGQEVGRPPRGSAWGRAGLGRTGRGSSQGPGAEAQPARPGRGLGFSQVEMRDLGGGGEL